MNTNALSDKSLTEAERNPELTHLEQLGCLKCTGNTLQFPKRCRFLNDKRKQTEPKCSFPFAYSFGKPGCPSIKRRGQSFPIRHLEACPLAVVGTEQATQVMKTNGYVQRGLWRVPYHNNQLLWEQAANIRAINHKLWDCYMACSPKQRRLLDRIIWRTVNP